MPSSLSAKFVATVTPIFLIVFFVLVGIYEWTGYKKSHRELVQRLDTLAASQSIILAQSIADRNTDQLSLLLASIISDRDLVGVEVIDESGKTLDRFGDMRVGDGDLSKSITVNFADGDGVRPVGKLMLVMTERYIVEELREHLIDDFLLAIALLMTGLFGAVFAHRRIVTRPLDRLLSAIRETDGASRGRVDWDSNDEIGHLIRSYNQMQARLGNYEQDLKAAREQLEQRVEERTHALEVARENAVDANRVKSKFMASMSHEFRTPMNAILGFTQVLQMSPEAASNARMRDRLSKIESSAKSLMGLISEIMEFARLESATGELHLESIEPAAVIDEAVALVAPLAESRNVTITPVSGAADADRILADPYKLRKALYHLLSNAIKYNHPDGRVDISVSRADERVCISVTDTGQGIPADQLENIYEPFSRLGREAGPVDGSGIGLTVTRQVIEAMDGEIGCESIEGTGTTFHVSFPVAS